MSTAVSRMGRPTGAVGGAKERANGDAIAFLRADHRQLISTLAALRKSRATVRRRARAQRLCSALRIHLLLEEELFYPAYLVATGNERVHHVAEVEHALLRSLIDKLEKTSVEDAYFPALVQVLTAVLTRHVETKEQRRGMFAEARRSTLELLELGENLRQRHQTLREKH